MRNLRNHGSKRRFKFFPIGSLAALEDIVKDNVRLHTHLRAPCVTVVGYPSEYCAVFYLGTTDYLSRNVLLCGQHERACRLVDCDTNLPNTTVNSDDLNKTVFVGVINVSEKGQRSLPCLVRLQPLNICPLNATQAIKVPGAITSETVFTVGDGEIDIPIESGVLEEVELPEQVVERRPQIVTYITNEQGEIGVNLLNLLQPEDALSCISVLHKLSDDSVRLALMHPLNQVVNDLEVIFCSAEFEERAIERMHLISSTTDEEV